MNKGPLAMVAHYSFVPVSFLVVVLTMDRAVVTLWYAVVRCGTWTWRPCSIYELAKGGRGMVAPRKSAAES